MCDEIETVLNPDLSSSDILPFLEEVNGDFPVPLSEKTDLGEFASKLAERADLVALLEPSGKLKGMAAGYIRNSRGPLSYLCMLAVSRDMRGFGAGGRMVACFVDEAKRQGALGVHLYADVANPAALKTYERLGFKRERFSVEPRPGDVHLLKLVNKTALVTAIGSFSASCVIDALHFCGFRVVGCDIYPREWVANSLKVDAFYQVPLAADTMNYLAALNKIVASEQVGYVLPLTDYEIDALRGEKLEALVCMSTDDAIGRCRDKLACYKYLSADFRDSLIETRALGDAECSELVYPVVCKPRAGRSSEGLVKARSARELSGKLQGVDTYAYCVQPEVQGRVVTVDVVRDGGSGRTIAIPREELLRTLNGAGTSVRVFPDESLTDLAVGIAGKLGVSGCVNLEFISEPNGRYRFLECNPRFSGGVEFSCMAGYDCVANHIRCFLGLLPGLFEQKGDVYMARSYEAHITSAPEDGRGGSR